MAGLTQLQVDHPGAVTTMALRQMHDLLAQLAVTVRRWLISQ